MSTVKQELSFIASVWVILGLVYLFALFCCAGCVGWQEPEPPNRSGPRYWRESEHMDVMTACQTACDDRMQAYTTSTGKCECAPARSHK